jgi:hypothetical protein
LPFLVFFALAMVVLLLQLVRVSVVRT